ncbi:MAG: HAMP domain-containing histidine kinase [Nitrospirales bacterium]|nr:HAMP domain-containing histidine kinase [Nitrospira sp.]MDR4501274.1 HAMP domain-containing histidine kinase [Nitrospirales bacterium]
MSPSIPKFKFSPRRSIFLKLFLIFLGTACVLMVVIRGFFFLAIDRSHSFKSDLFNNLTKYSAQLVKEIGTPPNKQRADALAEELGLQFRIRTPKESWSTDPSLPPINSLSVEQAYSGTTAQVGQFHRHPFVILNRADTQYAVFFLHRPFDELPAWSFGLLAGLVAIVIGGSYLVVRRLIRPVHWLTEGVKEIGKGKLDYQVPVTSSDELGDLAISFNEMGRQVHDMIQSRDRLLLDVSHELRSPLTRMKVAAEFIDDATVKEKIQQEINELEMMVTELLESERLKSQAGSLTRTQVDLVTLTQEVIHDYNDIGPGVELTTSLSTLILRLDHQRIRMAIRNVLENAIKFSRPEFGPIIVRIETTPGSASVSVQDFGLGIPAEDQARIFEPFYRVDPSRTRNTGGYGLGLSLVKKIMVAHEGNVRVSSEVGIGSTFILNFPVINS